MSDDNDECELSPEEELYDRLIDNQSALIFRIKLAWDWLNSDISEWKESDCEVKPYREALGDRVYFIMSKDGIKPPTCSKTKTVKLDGEDYTEMWLAHYYHARYFQPCRQVASFIAGRLTGEYHEGNDVSKEEDLARLCAAQKILAAEKTVRSPRTKSKDMK